MSFVDDDQAVAVPCVVEMAALPGRPVRGELLIGGQLLVAHDLRRQARPIDPLTPVAHELRRRHHQGVLASLERVLLDEGKADLGLARAHAIRVDDAVVPGEDPAGALISIALEWRQLNGCHLRFRERCLQLLSVQVEKRSQVDRLWVDKARIREQQRPKLLLVVGRLAPEVVEPFDGGAGYRWVVVNEAQLEVVKQPRSGQVR